MTIGGSSCGAFRDGIVRCRVTIVSFSRELPNEEKEAHLSSKGVGQVCTGVTMVVWVNRDDSNQWKKKVVVISNDSGTADETFVAGKYLHACAEGQI